MKRGRPPRRRKPSPLEADPVRTAMPGSGLRAPLKHRDESVLPDHILADDDYLRDETAPLPGVRSPDGENAFRWRIASAGLEHFAGAFDRAAPSTEAPNPIVLKPSRRESLMAVPLVMLANALVFAGWKAAGTIEPLGEILSRHFLVSSDHLADGRYATLLGASFSHNQVWHLVLNMIVLLSFGSVLERVWGTWRFASLYLAAGLSASLAHCAVSTLLLGRSDLAALGASGSLAGLLIAFALSFPRQRLLLFGMIRVPAFLAAAVLVALDVWGLFAQSHGGGLPIGHGAHLGGAAAGAVFYLAFIRPRR